TVAGQTFAWSSSDPVIATVDGTGVATGLAPGSVTITATTAGASGTATLSVQQVLTSVVVSPATATLNALGLTQSFSAVARDAGGNVSLGRTFAWSASPAGVATIDPVTGIAMALVAAGHRERGPERPRDGTGDRVRGYHGGHRWSHGKRHAVDRADGGVGGREPGHGGTGRHRGHTAVDRDRERRERQCHSWPVV